MSCWSVAACQMVSCFGQSGSAGRDGSKNRYSMAISLPSTSRVGSLADGAEDSP